MAASPGTRSRAPALSCPLGVVSAKGGVAALPEGPPGRSADRSTVLTPKSWGEASSGPARAEAGPCSFPRDSQRVPPRSGRLKEDNWQGTGKRKT